MRRLRDDESGQVIPLVGIVLMTVLLGVAALVIDFGVWYTKSREAQSVADAAALAGVYDLPGSPGAAAGDADTWAKTNGGALDSTAAVTSTDAPNDTISVAATEQAPAVFSRLFGISSITVHARASAQVAGVDDVDGSGTSSDGTGQPIPFAVGADTVRQTPIGQAATLDYGPSAAVAGGQFGLVDFANEQGGTPPGTLADWLTNGYPGKLATGTYQGITGNKFMPKSVRDAMAALVASGKVVLLPVFTGTNGASGGQMTYTIAGWAAFQPTAFDPNGDSSTLSGKFVRLDVSTDNQPPAQYFGVGHVKLTK